MMDSGFLPRECPEWPVPVPTSCLYTLQGPAGTGCSLGAAVRCVVPGSATRRQPTGHRKPRQRYLLTPACAWAWPWSCLRWAAKNCSRRHAGRPKSILPAARKTSMWLSVREPMMAGSTAWALRPGLWMSWLKSWAPWPLNACCPMRCVCPGSPVSLPWRNAAGVFCRAGAPGRLPPCAATWPRGELALAESGGRILLRWGDWSFAALDIDLAEELIDTMAPPDSGWIWHGGQRPDWLDESRLVQVREGQPLLAVLGRNAEAARVNLLSGP